MGLRVVDHLQPMLDAAQKAVIFGQLRRRLPSMRPAAASRCNASQVGPTRSSRIAAAPDQLLRLGEELDFADAAAADLDVVALDGDLRAAAMRVDLALDRVDVLDRREIEVLAPDEGLQLGAESARRRPDRRPPAAP